MAKAELEIVLTDNGGPIPTEPRPVSSISPVEPGVTATPVPSPASEVPTVSGGPGNAVTLQESLGDIADTIADAFGIGNLMSAAKRIANAVSSFNTSLGSAADILSTSRPVASVPSPSVAEEIPAVQVDTAASTAAEADAGTAAPVISGAEAAGTAAAVTTETGEAAPALGTTLAAVAGPVAAVVAGFAAVGAASVALSTALSSVVDNVAQYSADVAAATAESELGQEAAAIRRSNEIGPQLADFERSRGEMSERWADIMTSIYSLLLVGWKVIEPFLALALKGIDIATASLEAQVYALKSIYEKFTMQADASAKSWEQAQKAMRHIADVIAGKEDDPLEDSLLDQFQGIADDVRARRPKKRAAGDRGLPERGGGA